MWNRATMLQGAALAALWMSCGAADALELKCPAQIHTDQGVKGADAGWEAVSTFSAEMPNTLSGVQVFDGPPAQMASLVPDESRERKNGSVNVWKFEPGNSASMWVACSYSQTRVVLARRLPAGISQCEVAYGKAYIGVERISCR